jgi:hypothetical protein
MDESATVEAVQTPAVTLPEISDVPDIQDIIHDSKLNEPMPEDTQADTYVSAPEQTAADHDQPEHSVNGQEQDNLHGKELTDEEKSFMQQLIEREEALKQRELKYDAARILEQYGFSTDEKMINHIMRDNKEDMESYVRDLSDIVKQQVKKQLDQIMVGNPPRSHTGYVSSYSRSSKENYAQQIRTALM